MRTATALVPPPLLCILVILAVYAGGMLHPAYAGTGYPVEIRYPVIGPFLLGLGLGFLLASRRSAYDAGYRRAFRIIAVGLVLGGAVQLITMHPDPALSSRLAPLHIVAYFTCAWGVFRLPKRPIARTDVSLIVTDLVSAFVGMGTVYLVLLRDGVPVPRAAELFPILLGVQMLSMLLVLAIANTLVLRGLPVPDRRTVLWCAAALVMLVASLLAATISMAQLWSDRRIADLLYAGFLASESIVAWHFWRAPITPVPSFEAPALRRFIRLGPMPAMMLAGTVAVALSSIAAGQDRSALIASFGVFVSCVPIIARLQLASALRQAASDAQIAEREARLDAMMRLAGGFAHELNNALTTIMNAVALARLAPDADTRDRDLDEIDHAATRAAALARQTLVASGRSMPGRTAIPLAEMIARAVANAQDDLGSRWRIRTEIPEASIEALTDVEQCAGLVRLLVRIVRGAQPEGGELVIRLARHTFAERKETVGAPVSAGVYAGISVFDQRGLAAGDALPDASVLFDRDIVGEPTLAFDLTIARGLALSLHAGLELRAQRGHGACATMLLPVA